MLIADTSAWVEYLRRTESPADRALDRALAKGEVVMIEPVRAELLVGGPSNAEGGVLRRMVEGLSLELIHPRDDFERGADLYLRCRSAGVSPRGLLDCLVAAITQRTGLALLHSDRDLAHLARIGGLVEAPGSLATE